MINKKEIFSFNFFVQPLLKATSDILELAKNKQSSYACLTNVHMLVEAKKDTEFSKVLQEADLAVLDGMPLCWSMKLLQGLSPERIAGRHLMHEVIKDSIYQKQSIFIYGSKPNTLETAKNYFYSTYKGIQIAGVYAPPFRPLTEAEDLEVIQLITQSGASIVFVALGCPKQEKWMAKMKGKIPAVMLGIGIALEVLTGQQKSTPKWMETFGLEWLFRLCKEPRRLFKRYLTTNCAFLYLLMKEIIKKHKKNLKLSVSS